MSGRVPRSRASRRARARSCDRGRSSAPRSRRRARAAGPGRLRAACAPAVARRVRRRRASRSALPGGARARAVASQGHARAFPFGIDWRNIPRHAGTFFDAMAAGYEVLEPWYEHLYARLHTVLRAELTPPADVARPRALDAGCGTGFQTGILDEMGYAVHAPGPVARAAVHRAQEARSCAAGARRRSEIAVSRRELRRGHLLRQHVELRRRCARGARGDRARVAAGRPIARRVRRAVEPGPRLGLAQQSRRRSMGL